MILIDYKDRRPLYEQICERFEDLITKSILEVDSKLPSVRNLAMDLSINPNTIQRAYGELERKGYCYSIKGKGSFVADIKHMIPLKQKDFFLELSTLLEKSTQINLFEEDLISFIKEFYQNREVQHDRNL